MRVNGWIKRFVDGSWEEGKDKEVLAGRASWSRGRLEGMLRAEVHHGRYFLGICGPGEYWQSDDFSVNLSSGETQLETRRLQRKIVLPDTNMVVQRKESELLVFVYTGSPPYMPGEFLCVSPEMLGKWLTLELNLKDDSLQMNILPERI